MLRDIFCQDNAVGLLVRGYLSGHSAHAYIFSGADGVGRYKTACEYAKLLLCEKPIVEKDFADSCGVCESCRSFEAGAHPDFVHIYKELLEFTKDGKGKTPPLEMPIDVIREFLIAQASNRPLLSRAKIFVVSEAEKLNASSQNALLKILEEPPAYCTIILLCTRLEKLLATTKSRCGVLRFGPINEQHILEKLNETGLDSTKAKFFSRLAQGSIGQACEWSMLESKGAGLFDKKTAVVNSLAKYRYEDSLELANEFVRLAKELGDVWVKADEKTSKTDINRRAAGFILRMNISVLGDVMRLSLGEESKLINTDQKGQIAAVARMFGPAEAAERVEMCFESLGWLESNVNEKLLFERLLLNLAECDRMQV